MTTTSDTITFADVVHNSLEYRSDDPTDALILKLIDSPWVQRLRDISQTANTRLVYMFAEHSRFGHSLGVERLAAMTMDKLEQKFPDEIKKYRTAVSVAALLHDLGHIAPGSHMAYKTWFPGSPDLHEEVGAKIILEDPKINAFLKSFSSELPLMVSAILKESASMPPWTWELISGGGWNVDRGNWCIVDSVMAGVSYGKYNIPALIQSMVLTPNGHLALQENRVDAMLHFAVSRHAMYRQIYQHRTLLAADMINQALVKRAKSLIQDLPFADKDMESALKASGALELSLSTIFNMTESWWRYHITRWANSSDKILADLCDRLLHRRLLKTVRVSESDNYESLYAQARKVVENTGFDPEYYLHSISTVDMHSGDSKQSMPIIMEDNSVRAFSQAEPVFSKMVHESGQAVKRWLVMPVEAKEKLGRKR